MRICVLIPTYNEEKAIGSLVCEVRRHNLDCIVVDDGSLDQTFESAANSGAVVLKNSVNQGKGASLIKGFEYALRNGFDAVITMDGDGQHLAEEIPLFIQNASASKHHLFIGNRMGEIEEMPHVRKWTNSFMSWLLSGIIRQRIPDTQCGFRLIKIDVLKNLRLRTRKYETESELLIRASRSGFSIESIAIKTIYRGQKSRINPFVDTLRFLRFIVVELTLISRESKPKKQTG